ncbi:MAG: peptidoglycan-binding protein [Hyphomicrobiaceae bacterium]|nr:MAG: peptidoglycan-binding protein [Hyphomicrobiaceae bacterium]
MTPRQARIVLCSFLLLAAGVVINALYFQSKPASIASRAIVERTPARVEPERARKTSDPPQSTRSKAPSSEERPARVGRLKPDAAVVDVAPAAPEGEADPQTIRAVQREIKQRGYGPLVADGVMRLAARAAIMAYEHDQKLPLTGEASEALLKRILLGASAAAADLQGVSKAQSRHAESIIRSVQQWLAALGYQPGRADGRMGEDTVRALREFEMDKGLVPKGRISAEIVVRLTEALQPPKTASGR